MADFTFSFFGVAFYFIPVFKNRHLELSSVGMFFVLLVEIKYQRSFKKKKIKIAKVDGLLG